MEQDAKARLSRALAMNGTGLMVTDCCKRDAGTQHQCRVLIHFYRSMAGNMVARSSHIVFNVTIHMHPIMKNGTVYLVGAGPGDPGLMTVKGKTLIESADVLVYDALICSDIPAWARPGCECIYVGKRSSNHAMPQDEINQLLVSKAREGKNIVRLKGGDPMVFGRGGEEAAVLNQEGIPFEIVPGITSAIAGPAYAGIPVTHRKHCTQFTVFTGHESPDKKESSLDIEGIAKANGTKIILMGMSRLGEIMKSLVAHGQDADTPAAAIQWATTGRQKTVAGTVKTLDKLVQKAGLSSPAVIVIGDVVQERNSLNWFEELPLFGKRIVVTRTREQAGVLSGKLRSLGADVIELPTIRITDPTDIRTFATTVVDAHTYEWLIFSSPNGVERFFKAFFAAFNDIRSIGGARIAAIGPGTAAKLKEYGLAVDLMPQKSVAESLVKAFKDSRDEFGSIEHRTILWVHAEGARDVIAKGLSDMLAIVDECIAYNTVPETEDIAGAQELLRNEGADIITFTSSSTAENFFKLGLPWPDKCKAASIGPVTTKTLTELGHAPAIKATQYDIDGLVAAIVKSAGKK